MAPLLKSIEGVTIWSSDHHRLAEWYQQIFKLKKVQELAIPYDHAIALATEEGDLLLWIGEHSEVEGRNKDPFRIMISYFIDDVQKMESHLKEHNVEIIAGPAESPDGSRFFLTARDPEKNLIQLFQMK